MPDGIVPKSTTQEKTESVLGKLMDEWVKFDPDFGLEQTVEH